MGRGRRNLGEPRMNRVTRHPPTPDRSAVLTEPFLIDRSGSSTEFAALIGISDPWDFRGASRRPIRGASAGAEAFRVWR
jgi:hypothetical protein